MLAFLAQITSFIPGPAELTAVAPFVETVIRLIPSSKPLSILYMVEDALQGLASFAGKLGDALNNVVPQRLAAPAAAPIAPAATAPVPTA